MRDSLAEYVIFLDDDVCPVVRQPCTAAVSCVEAYIQAFKMNPKVRQVHTGPCFLLVLVILGGRVEGIASVNIQKSQHSTMLPLLLK